MCLHPTPARPQECSPTEEYRSYVCVCVCVVLGPIVREKQVKDGMALPTACTSSHALLHMTKSLQLQLQRSALHVQQYNTNVVWEKFMCVPLPHFKDACIYIHGRKPCSLLVAAPHLNTHTHSRTYALTHARTHPSFPGG